MIITDENILRLPCEDVWPEEIDDLRHKLEDELKRMKLIRSGVGLAAPQIGIHKKMAIIRATDNLINYKLDLINCELKQGYDKFIFRNEGCLSFPGIIVDTVRYKEIHIINNSVEPHSFIATGYIAAVVQHELDHLNGILLMDRRNKNGGK